jgi:hypothetical protein
MIHYNLLRNPNRTLLEAAQYSYYQDKMTEEEFNLVNSIFPKYSAWLLSVWLKNQSDRETIEMSPSAARGRLEKYKLLFEKGYFRSPGCLLQHIEYAQINKIPDLGTLHQVVNSGHANDFLEAMKFKSYKKEAKFETVYDGPDWFIAMPDNAMATMLFGGGDFGNGVQTKWCVASKSEKAVRHFKGYTEDLKGLCPLVFVQNNETKERWLIGGNENMIHDENNHEIWETEAEELYSNIPDEAKTKLDDLTGEKFSQLMLGELKEDFGHCDRCDDKFEDYDDMNSMADGEVWCNSCYESEGSYCENCGVNVPSDDIVYLDSDRRVCQNCAEGMSTCDDCGKTMDDNPRHFGRHRSPGVCDNSGTCYCGHCMDRHSTCYDCGDFSDDLEVGDNGDYYCHNCIDDHKEKKPEEEEEPEEGNIIESSKRLFRFKRIDR